MEEEKLFIYSYNEGYKFSVKTENKFDQAFYENLAVSLGIQIAEKTWRSRYNKFVVYDYEPYNTDGFDVTITLFSLDKTILLFFEHLMNKRRSEVFYLSKCLEISKIGLSSNDKTKQENKIE